MSYQYSIDEYLAPLPKPIKVYMDNGDKQIEATITEDNLFLSDGVAFIPSEFIKYGRRVLFPDNGKKLLFPDNDSYEFHNTDLLRALYVSEGWLKGENLWWLWRKMPVFYEHAGCTLEQYACRRVLEDIGQDSVSLCLKGAPDCVVKLMSDGTFLTETRSDLTASEVVEHLLGVSVSANFAYYSLKLADDDNHSFYDHMTNYIYQ
jgi:hypothetical protein